MLYRKDEKILEILKKDCKTPIKNISAQTGIPLTTVHNRIKNMEKHGIIKSYVALIDKKMIGRSISAWVMIDMADISSDKDNSDELAAKRIKEMPEVEECYLLTGNIDIIAKVNVSDTDSLNEFVTKKLRTIPGIKRTTTSVILKHER
jgi:DNA-binding Lrp family transcriptional regulator